MNYRVIIFTDLTTTAFGLNSFVPRRGVSALQKSSLMGLFATTFLCRFRWNFIKWNFKLGPLHELFNFRFFDTLLLDFSFFVDRFSSRFLDLSRRISLILVFRSSFEIGAFLWKLYLDLTTLLLHLIEFMSWIIFSKVGPLMMVLF